MLQKLRIQHHNSLINISIICFGIQFESSNIAIEK